MLLGSLQQTLINIIKIRSKNILFFLDIFFTNQINIFFLGDNLTSSKVNLISFLWRLFRLPLPFFKPVLSLSKGLLIAKRAPFKPGRNNR